MVTLLIFFKPLGCEWVKMRQDVNAIFFFFMFVWKKGFQYYLFAMHKKEYHKGRVGKTKLKFGLLINLPQIHTPTNKPNFRFGPPMFFVQF